MPLPTLCPLNVFLSLKVGQDKEKTAVCHRRANGILPRDANADAPLND
jgi:hypothetical protein